MNKLNRAGKFAIVSILLLLFSGTASAQTITVANTVSGAGCDANDMTLTIALQDFDQEYYLHRVIEAGGLRYGNQQFAYDTDFAGGDPLDDTDDGGQFSPLTGTWPLPAATEITVTYYIRDGFDGPPLYQATVVISDCEDPTVISNVAGVPADRATFRVTKFFADGNDEDEVVVSIDCNTGLILDQDKELENEEWVEFVVTDFTNGTLTCTIEEDEGPSGYVAEYEGNGDEGSCTYSEVGFGEAFTCDITNSPDYVDIVVDKDWIVTGDNNDVNLNYDLYAYCTNVFLEAEQQAGGDTYYPIENVDDNWGEGPDNETHTFRVKPGFPSSSCRVDESVYDSAIEVDNGCGSLTVSAGAGASCSITNSVFFEGIPTLSQYGMALMALLMLGVGFVSFRRFS